MKLFVDDYRPAPRGWERAYNVTEAIRKIAECKEDIEIVALDHDISGSTETFMPVAQYLLMYSYYCGLMHRPKIYIHTGNTVAAKVMLDLLEDQFECEIKDCMEIYSEGL